jgi:hypothetical protein
MVATMVLVAVDDRYWQPSSAMYGTSNALRRAGRELAGIER